MLGFLGQAGFFLEAGEKVVGGQIFGEVLHQILNQGQGFPQLTLTVEGHRQPHAGPGQILVRQKLAVGAFRLRVAAQGIEQFAAQALGFLLEGGELLRNVVAGFQGLVEAGLFHVLVGPEKDVFFEQGPPQALLQLIPGEGLDQVIVRDQLGHGHHIFVAPLGGNDHEDGGEGNELLVAQFFQELLAVPAVVQQIIGKNDVVVVGFDLTQHFNAGAGPVYRGDAQGGKHHGR